MASDETSRTSEQDLTPEEAELLAELDTIFSHPRADEILLSDWLHHGDLPMPSTRAILHVGHRVLWGPGISEEAGRLDRDALAKRIVRAFQEESQAQRVASVKRTSAMLRVVELEFTGESKGISPHAHEWITVLEDFLRPIDRWSHDTPDNLVLHGQRSLARGIVEALVNRALFTMDGDRIRGLAQAVDHVRGKKRMEAPQARRLAAEIIRWTPLLERKLGHSPTKTELRTFIIGINPESTPDHPTTWRDAYRIAGIPDDSDRSRMMDADQVTRLVRAVCSRS